MTPDELNTLGPQLENRLQKRAAHVIGENDRVLRGSSLLKEGNQSGFGALMFESHQSSQHNFENSCKELDVIVQIAHQMTPGVLGARLSGGGFGGSCVLLVKQVDVPEISAKIAMEYEKIVGSSCKIFPIKPSSGAKVLKL